MPPSAASLESVDARVASRPARASSRGGAPPLDRRHGARLRVGSAAGADRPGAAGVAERRGHRHRDHRLPEPGGPALHLQVPVGAADGPLRAGATARSPPRLARGEPARAGVDVAAAVGHVAQAIAAGFCVAGAGGGLRVGVARRGDRRLPYRLAACQRTRPGLVAQRAGLPAGDDRLGRRRADLDRPHARRRLELERGLPHDGVADDGSGGVLAAGVAAIGLCGGRAPGGAPRRDRISGGAARGVGGLRRDAAVRPGHRARAARAVARDQQRRRGAAGALGRPDDAAAGHRVHAAAGGLGGAQRALRDAAVGAVELLRAARRHRHSWCSSCCTSWATRSPVR